MSSINIKFIDYITAAEIPELPSTFAEEDLAVGKKITIHLFIGGWRTYKIKKIEGDDPKIVYVKRAINFRGILDLFRGRNHFHTSKNRRLFHG